MGTSNRTGCYIVAALAALSPVFLILVWWLFRDPDTLETVLRLGAYGLVAFGALFALVGVVNTLAQGRAMQSEIRAQAAKAYAEAEEFRAKAHLADAQAAKENLLASRDLVVADRGQQVFVREWNSETWAALHRIPSAYINGGWRDPSPQEWAAYLAWVNMDKQGQIGNDLQKQIAPGMPGLFEVLDGWERLMLVGPSGSGKTTLLQWLTSRCEGQVLMVDPHDDQATWPDNVSVVGGGMDWPAIGEALTGFAELVRARYEQRFLEQGKVRFDPVWLFFDEYLDIYAALGREASGIVQRALMGGRKISTGVCVASHSELTKPLGFEGRSDLLRGFRVVRLRGDKHAGISAVYEYQDSGERAIRLPGPYRPGAALPAEPWEISTPVADQAQTMTDQERAVLEYWDSTPEEDRRAWKAGVAGYGSPGGEQTRLAEETLRKYGRV